MNAGKSTALIQTAFNYEERGHRVFVLKPAIDTKSGQVSSRIGISRDIDLATQDTVDVRKIILEEHTQSKIGCVIIDEVQFLSPAQIDQLFLLAVVDDIPVIGYGLRTDFQSHSFPGSLRMLELAHVLEEMKTICRCGSKAILNARKVGQQFVAQGSQIAIDNNEEISYESLCGNCYVQLVGMPAS